MINIFIFNISLSDYPFFCIIIYWHAVSDIGDKMSMPRGDSLSSETYLYCMWMRRSRHRELGNARTWAIGRSAICSKARMQQCDPPSSPFHDARGEGKVPLARGRIYMGCLVNQESRVIGHEVYGGENGERSEGDRCLTVDKRPARYAAA